MQYFLYEEQGEGCDYTIGCGQRLREIPDVSNMDEALSLVSTLDTSSDWCLCSDNKEFELKRAQLLEVADVKEINLQRLQVARDAVRKQEEQQRVVSQEKTEYERLKKKFES